VSLLFAPKCSEKTQEKKREENNVEEKKRK
jgi:hypothetical protein